jgi:hypothetical protein
MPSWSSWKPRPIGVPGPFLCRNDLPATPRLAHKTRTGLPRRARCGLLLRLRGRPPACHRRGRSPHNQPTSDHADGATLGRWDAAASRRPRRPEMRVPWIATRSINDSEGGPRPTLRRTTRTCETMCKFGPMGRSRCTGAVTVQKRTETQPHPAGETPAPQWAAQKAGADG